MRPWAHLPPPLRGGGLSAKALLGAARIRAVTEGASPPLSSPDNLPASLAPSTALRSVSLHRLRRGGEQGLTFCVGALAAVALAGCDLTMTKQPKYGPQAAAALFADGTSAQAPPNGTVAQDTQASDQAASTPPPVTLALVERGRERHDIFCKPCHGVSGAGDGTIVARGFPPPPPYWDLKVAAATPAQLFDVITHGYGVMYPYSERIPPADRWAIVAYVRALEVAHTQGAPDVKPPAGSSGGRS